MTKQKTVKAPAASPDQRTCGILLENLNPVLPPDNEHTNSGVIEMSKAVTALADAISASANALQEVARHNQKAGIYLGGVTISNVGGHGLESKK